MEMNQLELLEKIRERAQAVWDTVPGEREGPEVREHTRALIDMKGALEDYLSWETDNA